MASYIEIARQAGVSITTVSRTLNNDPAVSARTRKRVLAVANRAGYVATMGRRITTQIGFTYTGEASLSHAFDAALLEGVTRGIGECRFDVVILDLQRDKQGGETYTQFFMRKGVRGVILRTNAETRSVCEAIAGEGFPHVVIADRFDSPDISFIDGESKPDSVRAVEYLVDLGHRRIAFGMHNVPDHDHADRFDGYQTALANHALPFSESLVFRHKWSLAGGATVLKMAMSMAEPPTAIYFADPMLAIGAVKKAHELGVRVPGELSIVGFDDTDLRFGVHPTLTAVCQDATALGYEAALYLTRALTKPSTERFRKTLPTFFEIHQSTGPPSDVRPGVVSGERRIASGNTRPHVAESPSVGVVPTATTRVAGTARERQGLP